MLLLLGRRCCWNWGALSSSARNVLAPQPGWSSRQLCNVVRSSGENALKAPALGVPAPRSRRSAPADGRGAATCGWWPATTPSGGDLRGRVARTCQLGHLQPFFQAGHLHGTLLGRAVVKSKDATNQVAVKPQGATTL